MKRKIRIINPDQPCPFAALVRGTWRPCEAGNDGHDADHKVSLRAEDTDTESLLIGWRRTG